MGLFAYLGIHTLGAVANDLLAGKEPTSSKAVGEKGLKEPGQSDKPEVPKDKAPSKPFDDGLVEFIAVVTAGGVMLSLGKETWGKRQSTEAWRVGAEGEERTALALATLPGTFVVFHDRKMPGSRANIDHIVVGPSGAFTIETKNYSGKRVTLRRGELRIDGRDITSAVTQSADQGRAVSDVLTMTVQPLLCIHGPDLPFRARVDGVRIVGGRGLVKVLRSGGELEPSEVARLAAIVEERFPAQG